MTWASLFSPLGSGPCPKPSPLKWLGFNDMWAAGSCAAPGPAVATKERSTSEKAAMRPRAWIFCIFYLPGIRCGRGSASAGTVPSGHSAAPGAEHPMLPRPNVGAFGVPIARIGRMDTLGWPENRKRPKGARLPLGLIR
jgi:hypothetical protein